MPARSNATTARYWFRLEFVNRSAAPVRRLVELTHGRLGTLVARLQSEDTDREILRTGAGLPVATRGASFPNAVIPIEVWPKSHATLLIYAASRDNMVMSARLWSESGFSAYQLRREMIVGAGLGALLVLEHLQPGRVSDHARAELRVAFRAARC